MAQLKMRLNELLINKQKASMTMEISGMSSGFSSPSKDNP